MILRFEAQKILIDIKHKFVIMYKFLLILDVQTEKPDVIIYLRYHSNSMRSTFYQLFKKYWSQIMFELILYNSTIPIEMNENSEKIEIRKLIENIKQNAIKYSF